MKTRSRYRSHLHEIFRWIKEGKTYEIALLLPESLKPNSRVIASLVRRLKKQKPDPENITIPKETFKFLLDTLSSLLSKKTSNKAKAQLEERVEAIRMQTEPSATRPFSHAAARAESDKALALAAKLKAEQAELARKAALVPPRRKFNTSVLEHLPEAPRH